MMVGLRTYYVPPRIVGSVKGWSGMNAPDGKSWLVERTKELGFNSIWFSPPHPNTSYQKWKDGRLYTGSTYAMTDHFGLDAEFSVLDRKVPRDQLSDEQRAAVDARDDEHLRHFTAEAKKAGLRVMADLVFNHVAADSPLVADEEARIEALKHHCVENGLEWKPIWSDKGRLNHDGQGTVVGVGFADPEGRGLTPFELRNDVRPGVEGGLPQAFFFKFHRNPDLSRFIDGVEGDQWDDITKINYESPGGREFFVDGKDGEPGYWNKLIDWYADRGFSDFRCDVAYRVPPYVWDSVVNHAHERVPDCIFMGETLGGPGEQIAAMGEARLQADPSRPAFDVGMSSMYWWDLKGDWLWQAELPTLEISSKYGAAGFPDNHDTKHTIAGRYLEDFAGHPEGNRIVRDIAVRNYAAAAMLNNSVYMQMGYEYGKEEQNEVFDGCVSVGVWNELVHRRGQPDNPLNMTGAVRAINELKRDLGVENCKVRVRDHQVSEDDKLTRIGVDYVDADSGQVTAQTTLLFNLHPENGPVTIADEIRRDLADNSAATPMQRLDLGNGEAERPNEIRDVMILHTPRRAEGPALSAEFPTRAPEASREQPADRDLVDQLEAALARRADERGGQRSGARLAAETITEQTAPPARKPPPARPRPKTPAL